MSADSESDPIGYAADVKPLFREKDRAAMLSHFDLWSLDDVREHAPTILARLDEGEMPCDGPWPADRVDLFRRWLAQGTAV
jgi:hypothetical protein